MSIIAEGFNIGNMNLSSKYCLTREEIDNIGEGEGYPDVFPIWCTDEDALYVFYRSTEGVPNIARLEDIPGSIEVPVLYPTLDPETNILTWEVRQATAEVPDPVTLMGGIDGKDGEDGLPGQDGASAYEIWLSLGNEGSEQDFINSLKGEKGDTGEATNIDSWSNSQILALKERLGLTTVLDDIDDLQQLVTQLTNRVAKLEEQISGGGDDDDGGDDNPDDGGGSDVPPDDGGDDNPDNPDDGGDDNPDDGGGSDNPDDGGDDNPDNPDDGGDDNPDDGGDDNPDNPDDSENTNPDEGSGNDNADPNSGSEDEVNGNDDSGATGNEDSTLDVNGDTTEDIDTTDGELSIVDAGDEG